MTLYRLMSISLPFPVLCSRPKTTMKCRLAQRPDPNSRRGLTPLWYDYRVRVSSSICKFPGWREGEIDRHLPIFGTCHCHYYSYYSRHYRSPLTAWNVGMTIKAPISGAQWIKCVIRSILRSKAVLFPQLESALSWRWRCAPNGV